MKSKISFFNVCIYKKNVKLYWPIWFSYWIILMLIMPVRTWLSYIQIKDSVILYGSQFEEDYIRTLYTVTNMDYHMVIITLFVVASATSVFGYLFNARNANMMHAFPVNRLELFGTNVLTGLSFLWVPQLICFFSTLVVCISFGETRIIYLGIWLIMVMVISFFLFAVACLSAMCTGNILAIPVLFASVNLGYIAIRQVVTEVIQFFAFGVNDLSDLINGKLNWLSPLFYIWDRVQFTLIRDKQQEHVIGMSYSGVNILASIFVIGIVVYFVTYIVYSRRHIECAGDMIAFEIIKPIYRWGIGIVCALFVTLISYDIINETGIKISDGLFIISSVVFGIIIFFIADMLIQKSFRVFSRKRLKEMFLYAVSFCGVLILLKVSGDILEKSFPNNEDVECAYIECNYTVKIEGDKINDVIALQNEIVENEKYFKKVKSNYFREILFKYKLKDGDTISRRYIVPYTDKSIKLVYENIYRYESVPDNMKKYLLCYDVGKCMGKATGGSLSVNCTETKNTGDVRINQKQTELLIKGIIKDIEEGKFQDIYAKDPATLPLKKYDDGTYIVNENYEEAYSYWVDLSFVLENFSDYMDISMDMNGLDNESEEYYGNYTSIYKNILEKSFSFNEKCENSIKALIDGGIVSNIEELHNISELNE